MVCIELARVDGSMSTFLMVHNSLLMLTIGLLGSEQQKKVSCCWNPCVGCRPSLMMCAIVLRQQLPLGCTAAEEGELSSTASAGLSQHEAAWFMLSSSARPLRGRGRNEDLQLSSQRAAQAWVWRQHHPSMPCCSGPCAAVKPVAAIQVWDVACMTSSCWQWLQSRQSCVTSKVPMTAPACRSCCQTWLR